MLLLQSDYACIGEVAKHCDYTKLCIAENEALKFDLAQLFCSEWSDIKEIWDEIIEYLAEVAECEAIPDCDPDLIPQPENYDFKYKLIFGGTFEGCNGKTRQFEGVKAMLIYYSYARYILINGFNDSPTGMVQKTNEFSIPKPLKELENFADKYRTMGYITFENTVGYLCANNTDVFTWWTNCEKCGCGTHKCGGTKARGYGFRSSIITKRI
jgi:hypothetical protein